MNTLCSLFGKFIEEQQYQARRSPETLRGYTRAFQMLLKFKPDIALSDLTDLTLTQFFRFLDDKNNGIKSSTIATYRSKLNTFFDWLIKKKELQENPFINIPYPVVLYNDRRYFTKEEFEKVLAALQTTSWQSLFIKKRNTLIVYIGFYTGLRSNEIIGLQLRDICENTKGGKYFYIRGETSKSKKDRNVPIHHQLEIMIQDYLQDRNKLKYTTPALLVSVKKDVAITKGTIKNIVKLIKRGSKVKFHMHRLRHTFAANVYRQTRDIYAVNRLLGHSTLKMTIQYLRNLPDDGLKESVNEINIEKMY
jgi:site-specific recombinase XerD